MNDYPDFTEEALKLLHARDERAGTFALLDVVQQLNRIDEVLVIHAEIMTRLVDQLTRIGNHLEDLDLAYAAKNFGLPKPSPYAGYIDEEKQP